MIEEDGSGIGEALGGFGANADLKQHKLAERKAAMRLDDGRRRKGPRRDIQFNPRVSKETKDLIDKIRKHEKCTQVDLIERMAQFYATARGIL